MGCGGSFQINQGALQGSESWGGREPGGGGHGPWAVACGLDTDRVLGSFLAEKCLEEHE